MSATADVVIIGAGIVGAACAMELAKEKLRVTVVDASFVGSGATAAGMGHVVVMDDSEAQFALTRYSQLLWSRLASELPDSVEYETPGTIWLAADDEEMAEAERKHQFYRDRDVPAEDATHAQLSDLDRNAARPGPRYGGLGRLGAPTV